MNASISSDSKNNNKSNKFKSSVQLDGAVLVGALGKDINELCTRARLVATWMDDGAPSMIVPSRTVLCWPSPAHSRSTAPIFVFDDDRRVA